MRWAHQIGFVVLLFGVQFEVNAQESGPNLGETLRWLADKISNSVTTSDLDIGISYEAVDFSSCSVRWTEIVTIKETGFRSWMKYSVPLGSVVETRVSEKRNNYGAFYTTVGTKNNVVREETSAGDDHNINSAAVMFADQDIARRVGRAFEHAAGLCKEAF